MVTVHDLGKPVDWRDFASGACGTRNGTVNACD